MKKKLSEILLLLSIWACVSPIVSPDKLVGKWNDSYFERRKDSTGKWSNWQENKSVKNLPSLEFTAKGKIL